jgi:murein DD-endopeptidase MepM/ murein hydrolase activator NlpD
MSDLGGWHWPAPGETRVTQGFLPGHGAVDIGMPEGTVIVAPQAGTITAQYADEGYGIHIILNTVDGARVILAHLSEILYPTGAEVEAGAPIGLSGNTGRSSGPHLHYEIQYQGSNLDPHYVIYGNIADTPPPYPESISGLPPGSPPPPPPGTSGYTGYAGYAGYGVPTPATYQAIAQGAISAINWRKVMLVTGGGFILMIGLFMLASEEAIKLSMRQISDPLKMAAEAIAE